MFIVADQADIHKLVQSKDMEERKRAAEELKNNFAILKDKEQAWYDLYRLTQDKNDDVRRDAASALGVCYSHLPEEYKKQAWYDLDGLMQDTPPQLMSDGVTDALKKFQGVQNFTLRWALRLLPYFILILVMAILIISPLKSNLVMWITGMIAAALSLFAFQKLMKLIPETFNELWNRKIIVCSPRTVSLDANMTEDMLSPVINILDSFQFRKQFLEYIKYLENLLNDPKQLIPGFLFSFLVLTWNGKNIEFLIAFIIGLMAWRMSVISIKIWQLGKEFYLRPQLLHADGCGGLGLLGNLCLWNALIVTIPGIFLGGWILVGFITEKNTEYFYQAELFTPLFSKLLLIPIAFAFICFFLPLWGLKQTMMIWRRDVHRRLNILSYSINHLDIQLLNKVDKLELQESEKMSKKLELMQEINKINHHIPVWPFNIRIMAKFAISQVVPLLGLIEQLIFERYL